MTAALDNLDPERQRVVRHHVRDLLARSESFGALPAEERRRMASQLVNVVAYLADPAAGQAQLADALATKAKTGAEKVQDRLANKSDAAGKDFVPAATKAGTDAFRDLVSSVDFPKFVSGLIEGVFTSIVDSSIRQMDAYGKLLEGVTKSVQQFATDNITPNQARDWLQSRHSDKLTLQVDGATPRLALNDDLPDGAMQQIGASIGMSQGPASLDDEESEAALVQNAQLEMARLRQQQLATMVLLGINRIVVTDGLINAKVVFDVKANDSVARKAKASMFDKTDQRTRSGTSAGWFGGEYDTDDTRHKTTVSSSTDDTSESKAQLKANLTGEVRVNFKSETFPLDKMASSVQISSVSERAKR